MRCGSPSTCLVAWGDAAHVVSEAADMYTLAAWFMEAHTGRQPVLLPGNEGAAVGKIEYSDAEYCDRARLFMNACLLRDPVQRLSANEATIHSCFTKNIVVSVSVLRAELWTLLTMLVRPGGHARQPHHPLNFTQTRRTVCTHQHPARAVACATHEGTTRGWVCDIVRCHSSPPGTVLCCWSRRRWCGATL